MAQATQAYRRSLSGSVGAGLSSVFNGAGRTYYILEHKVSSKYHKAGEAQEIIVDQIELGRDPKCQVQFDESFQTVSRRHAAIVRDGDNWKLIQLSKTNTTFLNGRPVQNEWYLQNGDEIQLAVNGPKLGFIIPSGNKAKTGSIGLSRRLSLFREQALRPYKTAMAIMGAVIVLLLGGGVTYGIYDYRNDVEREKMTAEQIAKMQHEADSIQAAMAAESAQQKADLEAKINRINRSYANLQQQLREAQVLDTASNDSAPRVSPSATLDKALAACEPFVYFIRVTRFEVTYEGESRSFEAGLCGSGFLLNDGRFVTARHVVEPWLFPSTDDLLMINAIVTSGGRVVAYIEAYSPTGDRLMFTSDQIIRNNSSDQREYYEGYEFTIPQNNAYDWAYYMVPNANGNGLTFNNNLSQNLPVRTHLTILGYPLAMGNDDRRPMYSQAIVAREGLYHGMIVTTSDGTEHGNSGGPVFATSRKGDLIVVGLVSAGRGEHSGVFVPIAEVHK